MADGRTIAYLTSAYARAADTFIRGEVRQLRAMGFTVHTFSVRRSDEKEMVSDDVLRERQNTEYLLHGKGSALRLLASTIIVAITSPARFVSALALAWRTSPPGLKGRLWALAYVMEAAHLARRLRAKGVQHLHNHLGENSAAVAMLASSLSGIPYSLTIHGPDEFDRPVQIALRTKIARSAFTVAISEYGRSQLYRWSEPQHWPRIHVVHCGVNGVFLGQPVASAPTEARLVSIGRLTEAKGQLLLVEAADRLRREGLKFQVVLIGDGPMRARLQQMIVERHLGDVVLLAGWKSSDQIREEILRSRALVLPSFAEGLPVVIMEAMALHRPVISTYVAAIPELVQPGVCGWLVPPGSVDALVGAIREALRAPQETLDRMGAAGAARVAERHDAAIEASKLAKLIDESLGGITTAACHPERSEGSGIARR